MFSTDGWLRLDILKGIKGKVGCKGAIRILNLFFIGPIEATQNSGVEHTDQEQENGTTNPGIIILRHHVEFCIACIAASISSFPGEVIGSNVKSIKSGRW